MLDDLRELYQEVILDHGRRPRNFGPLEDATHHAHGHNPLCGDKFTVRLRVDGGTIQEVRFEGTGCAISTASASLLTQVLRGKTRSEAQELLQGFVAMLTEAEDAPDASTLGKLAVFAGVKEFPVRVKCATLAWHTLKAALQEEGDAVSTE